MEIDCTLLARKEDSLVKVSPQASFNPSSLPFKTSSYNILTHADTIRTAKLSICKATYSPAAKMNKATAFDVLPVEIA